jgi:mannose-6-phosphate isomerase-like protein (cupin superfamily)
MKEESGTLTKKTSPFVLALPEDNGKYHEILGLKQSVSMKSGLVCLQPGENVGSHNTGSREELLVIVDGSGEVELEGCSNKKINEGCVAYIPPTTQHNVINTGEKPLRYIYIVSSI